MVIRYTISIRDISYLLPVTHAPSLSLLPLSLSLSFSLSLSLVSRATPTSLRRTGGAGCAVRA